MNNQPGVRPLEARMAWTGSRMIDVLNPDPDDILLSEIAVGLSREARYGGAATLVPWTVAQHTLLCLHFAREDGVTSWEILRTILLHDAPEYMLRDLIRPVKLHCPDYQQIEDRWWRVISAKFGLPERMPGMVKYYDDLACASEKDALVSPEAGAWPGLPEPRRIPGALLSLRPREAENLILREADDLFGFPSGGAGGRGHSRGAIFAEGRDHA